MKTAGIVFDFYDDPVGSVLKKAFPTPEELPEQIKVAHILTPEEHDVLRDDAYALRMSNEGKVMRKFACVDAGNTLLSMLYLEEAATALTDEAVKVAAANIAEFAQEFGLGLTPFIKAQVEVTKTAATGMGRTRDSMRQPMVGDEADWAQRTNLVSVRGGADSGRVIPTANQMKTAAMEGAYTHHQDKKGGPVQQAKDYHYRFGRDLTDQELNECPFHDEKKMGEWFKKKGVALHKVPGPAHIVMDFDKGEMRYKEKQSDVEGGGTTLTDDVKDNGPAKKNPAQPTPGPLKDPNSFAVGQGKGDCEVNYKSCIVDISGKGPALKTKKSSAENTACGRYPLDSYGDVQAACRYFDESWTEMYLGERREFAVKTAARAHDLGIPTSELLDRYGSTEYAPDIEAHIASRKANAPAFSETYDLLKEKRSSVTPDQFVQLLIEADSASGLRWEWGGAVTDPYLATYGGLEKSASADPWFWSDSSGNNVSEAQLQALAQTDSISQNFSADVADAFIKDPVGIFESMPDTTKTILARLAHNEG